MKICAPAALLFLTLLFSAPAFAQLGDVAITMGAAGAMNNNPIAQQSQLTEQAAAAAAGQPGAAAPAAVPGAPAAAGTPAVAAPAVPAPPGTPAAAVPGTPAVVVPPPEARLPADLHSPFKQSLFFSVQDIIAIQKAIKGQQTGGTGPAPAVIPMKRYISVAGISYKSPENWVVWINGQKVVPGYIPLKELVELGVAKDYVRIKWFDIGLNGVINLKMRPNQTYYIVEGVLLTGVVAP